MAASWKDTIYRQREFLAGMLKTPLETLAHQCAPAWGDRDRLDAVLLDGFPGIPYCTFLYVVTTDGVQISDNISADGLHREHFGRNRADRPYMKEAVPAWGYLLSDAYISLYANRPSLTALQVIHKDDEVLGYLGADFDLRNLPVTAQLYKEPDHWRQVKGDPAIRGQVFQQSRAESPMDRQMDQAMSILEELIGERGMFQCIIHFSSSQATIWVIDDPLRYRLLDSEALADPDICLAYPLRQYPQDAVIPKASVGDILKGMTKLRLTDETIYLRSASVNIFNGMISLTFSCDGSHYMSYGEFLDKDIHFWFGDAA